MGSNGCKKGSDCTYEHNWSAFSNAEKASRCKSCGSKNHKSPDCKAGTRLDDNKPKAKAPKVQGIAGPPKAPAEVSQVTPAPPSPEVNQQQIKGMLADAAAILQQVMPGGTTGRPPAAPTTQAVPIAGQPQTPSQRSDPPATVAGTPVTLASLQAQLDTLRSVARDYEVRMLVSPVVPDDRIVKAVALLDSGATHPVIPYEEGLKGLQRVPVTLAGDERQEWWRTPGGTLVVPPPAEASGDGKQVQTIIPLGALVEGLGCQVTWSRRRGLTVVHPSLGKLKHRSFSQHVPIHPGESGTPANIRA